MEYTEVRDDGGRVWRLRYPMRALRWFEAQTGEAFTTMMDAFSAERFTLEQVGYLVAAGLYHDNPDVTLDDADDLIEAVGMYPALAAVASAIEQSAFVKGRAEAEEGTSEKNARGTGTRSSRRRPTSA